MAVNLVKNNKFKIILTDKNNQLVDIDYTINNTLLAEKWFRKIKHLQNIPIDPIESATENVSDLSDIYKQFCEYADLDALTLDVDNITQNELNALHSMYEDNHDRLSRLKNNSILYKFHHAIHKKEGSASARNTIQVGWGINEGPLAENLDCNQYCEPTIKKNFIYATESELGKTPSQYWKNGEPADQTRFNQLCRPHITLRARFHISLIDVEPVGFEKEFVDWFSKYSGPWLAKYELASWRPVDEQSAPLLAHTDCKDTLDQYEFKSINII